MYESKTFRNGVLAAFLNCKIILRRDEVDINNLKLSPFKLHDNDIQWVQTTLDKMSVEEKVGQLFCLIPGFPGFTPDDIRNQMMLKPGGFMLRPLDTQAGIDVVNMVNDLTDIPLLLAADLEKGGNGVSNDGTTIGSPLSVAATGDVTYASKLGTLCAKEGKAIGLNWTFGPIADIDKNFLNPITNVRTFGSDVQRVKDMSVAYVKAAQEQGVAASCKHFPGDGIDFRDQHVVGSVNTLSVEEWENTFGEIYRACIEAGTMTIMIGHIMQPAWSKKINPNLTDEEILPASISKELLEGLLRKHLGFNGLILTDATTMTGFMQTMPRPDLVRQVFVAGADMFFSQLILTRTLNMRWTA
jgi:beta-N-acetylhexosaminidase